VATFLKKVNNLSQQYKLLSTYEVKEEITSHSNFVSPALYSLTRIGKLRVKY
jgi:hypothetical protein